MNFAHPGLLLLAAGSAPLLALFFFWSWRTRRRLIREFVPPRLQSTLTLGLSPKRAAGRAALLVLALATLLVALARPRFGAGAVEVKQRGLDIVVAIDTSRSMLAEDAGPGISRLQRARLATLDLAHLAKRDRLGLVAFAGTAFLQCPLTIDDAAFQQSVDSLEPGIIPQGGTALGPAITTALAAFGSDQDNVRVLVLFTDGEDHESGAAEAARHAAERGLRVFTVGVGSTHGELIRIRDQDGNPTFLKDDQGNAVKSALNEDLLREVATLTGGFYLPLQGARAMQELYQRGLEPLPRADLASRVMDQFHERFQWPLGLALLLLVWETLLPERARTQGHARAVRLSHPALRNSGATTALLLATLGLGLILATTPRTLASTASAWRDYQQGNFDQAQQEYERLARSRPDDPRYRFNAGAAAYRAGNFTNAVQLFQGALASPDLKLQHDGFYNLGNAQFRLGESTSDPTLRQSSWENSIRSYDAALQLDPQDQRTRQNLDFVRQRLDQLKQQQQQQQQQNPSKDPQDKQDKQDQDQNQNQDQQQQQQNNDPNKDPQQSQDQSSQPSPDPRKDPQNSNDQKQPDDQESKSEPSPSQDQDPKQEPAPSNPDPKGSKDPKDAPRPNASDPKNQPEGDAAAQDAGESSPPGQMTPKQALRLLDTARGEEKMVPLDRRRARSRAFKDW